MKCSCPDWEPNIKIVNAPLVLQTVRMGGPGYTGKQFVFCPWCGTKLLEDNAPLPPPAPFPMARRLAAEQRSILDNLKEKPL